MMNTKIFLTAVFCCFITIGCASYSDEMRASNNMFFMSQCKEADPATGMQNLSACVDTLHNQKEKEVVDKKNQSRWSNVFGGILGLLGAGVAVNESFNRKDTSFNYQKPYFFNPPTLFNQPSNNYLQAPSNYYLQQPSNNYVQPGNNYLQPTNNYLQPVNTYVQPVNTYVQPGNNYLQPANCFSSSVNGMIPIACK